MNNKGNQFQVYIYPLLLNLPATPGFLPPLKIITEPGAEFPVLTWHLPTGHLCYTQYCIICQSYTPNSSLIFKKSRNRLKDCGSAEDCTCLRLIRDSLNQTPMIEGKA